MTRLLLAILPIALLAQIPAPSPQGGGSGGGGAPSGPAGAVQATTGSAFAATTLPIDLGVLGAVADDTTDNSTIVNAAIALAQSSATGSHHLCFPPAANKYRINSLNPIPGNGNMEPDRSLNEQWAIEISTCGGGGQYWQNQLSSAAFPVATLDLRGTPSTGGKITDLNLGALYIHDLMLYDGGSPTAYSVTGGTLTSIVVATNVATATFSAPPVGDMKGAQWVVSGSTTSALNGNYRLTGVSGSTVTFTTSGVGNATYNNGALTMSYSAPFIYDTNATMSLQNLTFVGNGTAGQNGIVLGGQSNATSNTFDGGFQGYGTNGINLTFSNMNSSHVFQAYANNTVWNNINWIHNDAGDTAVQCDAVVGGIGQSGLQNMFLASTLDIASAAGSYSKYGIDLNGCVDNIFDIQIEDIGAFTGPSFLHYGSSSSSGNRFMFSGLGTAVLANFTASTLLNSYISLDGATLIPTATGTLGQVYSQSLAVVKGCDNYTASDGNIPNGLMAINNGQNKYLVFCYDETNDTAIIDSYLFGGGLNRKLKIQASGGNTTFGGLIQQAIVYSAAGTALPSCAAAIDNATAIVSDATAPTIGGAYTSGGSVTSGVVCKNGTGWLTY